MWSSCPALRRKTLFSAIPVPYALTSLIFNKRTTLRYNLHHRHRVTCTFKMNVIKIRNIAFPIFTLNSVMRHDGNKDPVGPVVCNCSNLTWNYIIIGHVFTNYFSTEGRTFKHHLQTNDSIWLIVLWTHCTAVHLEVIIFSFHIIILKG